jgi:homoserine kinase
VAGQQSDKQLPHQFHLASSRSTYWRAGLCSIDRALATSEGTHRCCLNAIPHQDAVSQLNKCCGLNAGLTAPTRSTCWQQRKIILHQKYRRRGDATQLLRSMTKLRAAGVAAFISGAGPTVLVLHTGIGMLKRHD